jgi:hypothetical protein
MIIAVKFWLVFEPRATRLGGASIRDNMLREVGARVRADVV